MAHVILAFYKIRIDDFFGVILCAVDYESNESLFMINKYNNSTEHIYIHYILDREQDKHEKFSGYLDDVLSEAVQYLIDPLIIEMILKLGANPNIYQEASDTNSLIDHILYVVDSGRHGIFSVLSDTGENTKSFSIAEDLFLLYRNVIGVTQEYDHLIDDEDDESIYENNEICRKYRVDCRNFDDIIEYGVNDRLYQSVQLLLKYGAKLYNENEYHTRDELIKTIYTTVEQSGHILSSFKLKYVTNVLQVP